MHQHLINASIQLVPITDAAVAMPKIDEAIALIQQSGLLYEVGPFGTTVEGRYLEVMELVNQINQMMAAKSRAEWVLNIQMHIKPDTDIRMHEKTEKHR